MGAAASNLVTGANKAAGGPRFLPPMSLFSFHWGKELMLSVIFLIDLFPNPCLPHGKGPSLASICNWFKITDSWLLHYHDNIPLLQTCRLSFWCHLVSNSLDYCNPFFKEVSFSPPPTGLVVVSIHFQFAITFTSTGLSLLTAIF